MDALRELDHCLQNAYGVCRSVLDWRHLLIQANTCELTIAASVAATPPLYADGRGYDVGKALAAVRRHSCLLSDFGCHAAVAAAAGQV